MLCKTMIYNVFCRWTIDVIEQKVKHCTEKLYMKKNLLSKCAEMDRTNKTTTAGLKPFTACGSPYHAACCSTIIQYYF